MKSEELHKPESKLEKIINKIVDMFPRTDGFNDINPVLSSHTV